MSRVGRRAFGAAWGVVVATGLLAWGGPGSREGVGGIRDYRYWDEMNFASAWFLAGRFPARLRCDDQGASFNTLLLRKKDAAGIGAWPFWRTVPARPFRACTVEPLRRFDDVGRVALLTTGFHVLGGIAPSLLFWLALLAAVPVLTWIAADLASEGYPVAGPVFLITTGLSSFVAEALALAYSPVGFHVLAALILCAFAVSVVWRRRAAGAFLGRCAVAGILLAVCIVCRGGALLLAPGFLAAALAGGWAAGTHVRARLALVAGGLLLLALPYVAARGLLEASVRASGAEPSLPRHHAVWYGVWTGLGDFDRSKGYRWEDHATVNEVLKREGGTPMTDVYDPANESILRRRILADIRADPLWYVRILASRFWAAIGLRKLAPWPPMDGRGIEPRAHPNEGAIDEYYRLTATADVFGLGRWRQELPVALVIAPLLAFVGLARRDGRGRLALACVALGVLTPPILITTASAIETQAVLVLFLAGAALGAQHVADRLGPSSGDAVALRGGA